MNGLKNLHKKTKTLKIIRFFKKFEEIVDFLENGTHVYTFFLDDCLINHEICNEYSKNSHNLIEKIVDINF